MLVKDTTKNGTNQNGKNCNFVLEISSKSLLRFPGEKKVLKSIPEIQHVALTVNDVQHKKPQNIDKVSSICYRMFAYAVFIISSFPSWLPRCCWMCYVFFCAPLAKIIQSIKYRLKMANKNSHEHDKYVTHEPHIVCLLCAFIYIPFSGFLREIFLLFESCLLALDFCSCICYFSELTFCIWGNSTGFKGFDVLVLIFY